MPLLKTKLYTIDDIYALPDGKRAELLDGRIYDMAPPSPLHQELVAVLTTSLQNYIAKKHGNCKVYPAPFAVFIKEDDSNYVEPDISLVCDHNKISNRGCEGAPDFIIEIVSPSSRKMDYSTKMRFMQMQEFENTGLSIRLENALPYIVTKKMSRLLSFLLAIQLN